MKISLIQSDIAWNAPGENVERCRGLAREALAQGGELLVFPEMFTCGFSLPAGEVAEAACREGRSFLKELATSNRCFTLGSTPEIAPSAEIFNTAWLYKPDGSFESYRKIHLFSYGDETRRYSAGNAVLTCQIAGVRCTFFICYDLRFTMPFFAKAAETDLFVVIANWPAPRREHWISLLRARAIEYQCFVAGINRVGSGGGLEYSGDSALFGPDGAPLLQMGGTELVASAEVDPGKVASWREVFPALKDRRAELYRSMKFLE